MARSPVRVGPIHEEHRTQKEGVMPRGNRDEWWQSTALTAIEHLASLPMTFTASDLDDLGVPTPDHPCRYGSVFSLAKRLKLIRRVGYAPSRRAGRDGGVCAVWIGTSQELAAATSAAAPRA